MHMQFACLRRLLILHSTRLTSASLVGASVLSGLAELPFDTHCFGMQIGAKIPAGQEPDLGMKILLVSYLTCCSYCESGRSWAVLCLPIHVVQDWCSSQTVDACKRRICLPESKPLQRFCALLKKHRYLYFFVRGKMSILTTIHTSS